MKKTITLLLALMLSFSWAKAQKMIYDQLGTTNLGNQWISADGFGFQTYRALSADDFDVPAEGMTITGIVFNYSNNYFESLKVKIYETTAGLPGEVWESFEVTTWEIRPEGDGYRIKVLFDYDVPLTEGKYWVSVAGSGQWYQGGWFLNDSPTVLGEQAKYMALTDEFMGNPLPNPTWGENPNADGEHYNLSFGLLTLPDDNDLAIKNIVSPVPGETTADQEITVAIENAGMVTQSTYDVMFQVSATVDGVFTELEYASESVTYDIARAEVYDYTFTKKVDMSVVRDYSLKAWVKLIGDSNPANDFAVADVKNYGNLYIMGTDAVVNACDGIFVDDGSVLGTYTEASTGTITFYPETVGARIGLEFTKFDVGGDVGVFNIYDGEDTNAPKLYEYVRYSGNNPTYVQARNAKGAITVEILVEWPYQLDGWEATVSCVTPSAIDFMAIGLTVGNEMDFNFKGNSVEVNAQITNGGAEDASRKVYLLENEVKVDSLMTKMLMPGEIENLVFAWVPTLVSNNVSVKVMVENDPQETNGDNSVENVVAVYKAGNLIESFEAGVMPLAWMSKNGKSEIYENDYTASHGKFYLKVAPGDTVIMPIVLPADMDEFIFDAYPDYGSEVYLLASNNMEGPWDTIGAAPYITYTMSTFTFDVSAWKDVPHYFAFTHNGSYAANIDFVRGSQLHYFENDLMAIELKAPSHVKTNVETGFEVSLINIGTKDIMGNQYMIEVRSHDSVYTVIDGVDLASMAEVTLSQLYTFTTVDTIALHAHIMFEGEERIDNNMSNMEDVFVLDAYSNGGTTTGTSSAMLNLGSLNSIAEMIYYPSEVGLYGSLKGFELTYDMTYDEEELGIPVTFYVGTTTSTKLVTDDDPYTASWIDTDSLEFTLAFSGLVDFKNGENHSLYFPFNEPLAYNGKDNLVIIAIKDSLPGIYKYPYFHSMDSDSSRFIYGNNNSSKIDPSNIEVAYGNVNSYQIPNFRFYFDNPGAPDFTSEPVAMVPENSTYTYNVAIAFESPMAITIEATVAPEWLSLVKVTETTYTLSGTAVYGTYPIELVATDGVYSATQRFELIVGAVPVFTSTPVTSITEGEAYVYNVAVTYNGDDAVTLTSSNLPSWATLTDNGDGTAILSGTPSVIGVHAVTINANGKYYSADQSFNIDVVVGANEVKAANFTVYPNPAKSLITLANVENSTIMIYDILGHVVKTHNAISSVEKISISDLNKGVYMIVMTNNAGKISQRLVIE